MKEVTGSLIAKGLKFGIVVSRFNSFLTEQLVKGAVDAFVRMGGSEADLELIRVPGAYEIPLAALGCVDAVVLFEQDTPTELIKLIRPDILVKGGDYKPEQLAGRQYAGQVQILNYEEGYSTTGVVEKIAQLAKEGKL